LLRKFELENIKKWEMKNKSPIAESSHSNESNERVRLPFGKYMLKKRPYALLGAVFFVSAWCIDTFYIEKLKKSNFDYREKIKKFDADFNNKNILANQETVLYSEINNVGAIKDLNYFPVLKKSLFNNTLSLIASYANIISDGVEISVTEYYGNGAFHFDDSTVVKLRDLVDILTDSLSNHDSPGAIDRYQLYAYKGLNYATSELEKYLPDIRGSIDFITNKINEETYEQSSFYLYLYAIGSIIVFMDLLLSGWKEYNKTK
jgi:hypothetical protein